MRTAHIVTTETDAAHFTAPDGDISYRLTKNTLTRSHGGHDLPLARNIAGVEFHREGDLVHMHLTLGARRKDDHRPEAAVSATARMRIRKQPKVVVK